MKPYAYQAKIINDKPTKTGLWLGCGTGKTFVALSMAQGVVLVVAPKTIRDDKVWERQWERMVMDQVNAGILLPDIRITKMAVISKEDFRRDSSWLPKFDTVIIDESHTVCGLTPNVRYVKKMPIPKASQLFDAMNVYLAKHPPERLYLCSATPIKNPMAVLAAAWLLGRTWDFYHWRSVFYVKLPMPGRMEVWSAKTDSDTKDRLAKAVKSLGYTGRLSDFTDVPAQTHVVKHIPLSASQVTAIKMLPMEFPDPIVLVGKKHQVEQGVLAGNEFESAQTFETGKIEAIIALAQEYDKVLVFAKYTAQIKMIAEALSLNTGSEVFMLTGETKNRRDVIAEAEASNHCIVVCQSQISAGYELPSFRCTVFASESWSYVDHEQSLGRTLRMNKLAPNLYVYLVSGQIDKSVREAITTKKDFSERVFINNDND